MLVVKTVAGSHLFGTNTPSSDLDYKGIYLPSPRDILLGNVKDSVQESTGDNYSRNTKDDIDVELYSLKKFFHMLAQGQTIAYEMLFTPKEMILESSELWEYITRNRVSYLHKQTAGFVGYCRQQAAKYGIKGSRMGALKKTLEVLSSLEDWNLPLYQYLKRLQAKLFQVDHVGFVSMEGQPHMFLEVCTRKFQVTQKTKDVINILQKIYDNYGERAKQAERNEGIDWKALSHAVRVYYQAKEILEDHTLTLPLPQRDLLIKIKRGEYPYKVVQTLIEDGLADIEELVKTSTLPAHLDTSITDDLIYEQYKRVILEA